MQNGFIRDGVILILWIVWSASALALAGLFLG